MGFKEVLKNAAKKARKGKPMPKGKGKPAPKKGC